MERVRSYTLCHVWGDHILSLAIERIFSPAKRGFLLVQYYVRTLDKLRYNVRLDSNMKRFDRIQGVANVGGVANIAGASGKTSLKDYPLATLILARHPPRSKRIRYIEPQLHRSNHPVSEHHLSFYVMHPLVRLADASLVMDRECEACPIRKKVSDVSIRGRKDERC